MPPTTAPTETPKAALPQTPRIRYTKGPAELEFGGHLLKRDVWVGPVDNSLALEAVYPGRVAEYGFEQQGATKPPKPAAPAATATPAADTTTTTKE